MRRHSGLVLTLILISVHQLFAQSADPDFMRSMGKMYVVVGVLLIIFIVLVIYLVYLDRKVTKIENTHFNDKKDQ